MKNILLKLNINFVKILILGLIFLQFSSVAQAQRYDESRYQYCRERAYDISGWNGRAPREYRRGQALKGAIKGAAGGAAIGWISGNSSKKAAKKGAALGLLIGAIKQGKDKKKRKKQERRRRDFRNELDDCMDSNYRY